MEKRLNSYQEIKKLNPKFKKFLKIGFNLKYWLYRLNWILIEKLHYVTKFPLHIDVETCNICNLKCVMCPHSIDKVMNKKFIELDLVRKIIDEGSKYGLKGLKLNIRGEPLLHKDLVEIVRYAKQKGILEVMFNTNATLLTPEKTEQLIKAGLDLIIISIDGATKETYEKIRVGARFENVINNVKFLCEYREKNKLKKPIIRLQFVKMKENIHELPLYIKQWKHHVDVMTANNYSRRVESENDKKTFELDTVGRTNCPHPWHRLSITSSGNILMCCGDWYEKGILGNIKNDNLYDIWHSKEMNKRRELLKKEKLNEIEACKDCFVLASYKWKKKK